MKATFLFILACFSTLAFSQNLTDTTPINITKTWSQEPNGYTYPMRIRVPTGAVPQGGFPVCIVLHGNGGNGFGTVAQNASVLACHILVGPTGYQNTWNICAETSDAPDVEMIDDLVNLLQGYANINPNQIRILGFSNGGGLANRVFIENTNPGIDLVCAIVTQLHEPQYHANAFYKPSTETNPTSNFCGYGTLANPLSTRKYLSICNENDSIIYYAGGTSVVGVDFLPAELAAFRIAQNQGFAGSQLTAGTPMGNPAVSEFSYLSGDVVHLKGDAGHGMNTTQRAYITDFFSDCSVATGWEDEQRPGFKVYPNPTQVTITLECAFTHPMPYTILNPLGQQVASGTMTSEKVQIDLGQFPPNLYFLSIDGQTIKIVKQ